MPTPPLQSSGSSAAPEIADSSEVFTPAVATPTCSSSGLSPLPDIVVQSFDQDDATTEPSPRESRVSHLRSPPSVSIEEQSETSQSETSQSDETDTSDEADGHFLAPPPRDSDDIDPLSSTLSLMRLHSRSTTPDPSTERRFRRTPSNIWYQVRGQDADDEDDDEDDDVSETCASSFPESFARSIRAIQRAQGSLDKRTTELEKELATLRSEFASSVDTSKALLQKTRESILKERRTMEKTNETAADGMMSLEQKLARAQASIATLQAQHSADKEAMEQMANDIAEVLAIQEDMGCRLLRLNESQQSICDTAGHTRDLLTELPHVMQTTSLSMDELVLADHRGGDSRGLTFAEELAALASRNLRFSPESVPLASPDLTDHLDSSDDTLRELEDDKPVPKGAFELSFNASRGNDARPHIHANGRAVIDSSIAIKSSAVGDELNTSERPDCSHFTQDSACLPLAGSVPTASSDSTSSLEHHTLRSVVRTPDFPTRLLATHLTSLSDMKLGDLVGVLEWPFKDVKVKASVKKMRETLDVKLSAGVKNVRESFMAYAPRAHVMYGPTIVSTILTLVVVVPTIMMWRRQGAPASPVPEPVHVSEHPIWDSL